MQTWLNSASWTKMSATWLAGRALWWIWIWIWANEDVHRVQGSCWVLQASLITNAWFFELWMLHMWRAHFTNRSMTCVWYKHTPDHCQGTYGAGEPPYWVFFAFSLSLSSSSFFIPRGTKSSCNRIQLGRIWIAVPTETSKMSLPWQQDIILHNIEPRPAHLSLCQSIQTISISLSFSFFPQSLSSHLILQIASCYNVMKIEPASE